MFLYPVDILNINYIINDVKKIIFLLTALFFINIANAEEIPPRGTVLTQNNIPIHWQYMEDYANALKQAFDNKKIFHLRGWGGAYDFIVTKNGEIKDIRGTIFQNDYYDKKIKEVILSVKPSKFYEGMNEADMLFSIYLGYQHYDEIDISVGFNLRYNKDIFNITIDLDK